MASEYSEQLIRQKWEELEKKCTLVTETYQRSYQRLDLEQENGIRLSYVSPGCVWELLIEAGDFDEKVVIDFPKWKGMEFDVLVLDVPSKDTRHINFYLEKREHRDIFVSVCRDLIQGLDCCLTNESRRAEISDFLTRWNRFFEHYGQEGLSPEKQRGLYGELWWLRRMINANINLSVIVNSWKGCKRGYHDFEIGSNVIEVKTTMTKEPRRILINNERQLNDLALDSLHLFVLTLRKIDEGGDTLPGIIESIRNSFAGKSSEYSFEHALMDAGYIDIHAYIYKSSYSVIKEDFFHVQEGFPRIIDAPQGIGDLHYSVVLAACEEFRCDIDTYMQNIGV